jgi:hypothetical protein
MVFDKTVNNGHNNTYFYRICVYFNFFKNHLQLIDHLIMDKKNLSVKFTKYIHDSQLC